MKKRGKKIKTVDYESLKQAKIALLTKIVDSLDDNLCSMSSCEIRLRLLDIMDV